MSLVVETLAYGTFALNLGLVVLAFAFLAQRFQIVDIENIEKVGEVKQWLHDYYLELAFLQALVATLGSLYMSNILGWTPCRLCWFQRILIYPLVIILLVGIVLQKKDVKDYVVPIAFIGLPISLYHYFVQRIDQFHSAGCSVFSVSCSTEYTFHFGYITIPFMAFTALLVILVLMWKFSSKEH